MRARLAALVLAFGCNSSAPRSTSAPPGAEAPATAAAAAAKPQASSKPPAPGLTPPVGCSAAEGKTMTREQCTCVGGRVSLSRGDGAQEHCAVGEAELGTIRVGIEGGWCCKAP